jgi:hypothetical protein
MSRASCPFRVLSALPIAVFAIVMAVDAATVVAPVENDSSAAQVFVVGTLYRRHAEVPAYDHAALRRVIDAIEPEALVLDVSPNELARREVSPGKQEYVRVIFPWLDAHPVPVYAGEPGQPLFDEIVQSTIAANESFTAKHPDMAAQLKRYADETYATLGLLWTSTAAVNAPVTGDVLAARRRVVDALIGGADADGWRRWNDHAAQQVMQVARAHPGKRVLVLTGIENRPAVMERLDGKRGIELVAMEPWLARHVDAVRAR